MSVIRIDDRLAIERALRRDPALHLYELGDLDDFFWPHTTWYALRSAEAAPIALLYTATELPVLILLGREHEREEIRALLAALEPVLPARFYAHLSPGLAAELAPVFVVEPHGVHERMVLAGGRLVETVDTTSAQRLTVADRDEMLALYGAAYPDHWFDARMLETGMFFGVRRDGVLSSVAGIHVVSEHYRVAALGNIATLPSARGGGLGRIATAAVCKELLARRTAPIGLNVESTNVPAIRMYRTLGFESIAMYEELLARRAR